MPKLNVAVVHKLPQAEALKRIKSLLGQVKIQHANKISDLQESWTGNTGSFSLKAAGFSFSGTVAVKTSSVEVNGEMPWAAAFFKGRIEAAIRDRAKILLA